MGQLAKRMTDAVLDRVASQSRPKVIVAYHGSPHYFDRFDASKIGTGEGAQTYGHGLYFAGEEAVARHYRDIWPRVPSGEAAKALKEMQERAVALELEASGIWDAMNQAADERGSLSPGWGALRGVPQDVQDALMPRLREIGDQLSALRMDQQRAQDGLRGHMYQVELGVPEEALLDWDAPMSRQPELVSDMVSDWVSGGSLGMADQAGDGRRLWHHMKDGYGAKRAAGRLLDAGIPGVRYLDGNSRGAGQGTRNYVMFPGTEDRIRILRKYGLLGPAAAGMLGDEE